MNRKMLFSVPVAITVGLGALLTTGTAQAINFGDMMNPGRWFGGDHDRYDDRYYGGYGYGPYGYPYGGPYGGWGGPYGGWGGPYGGGWGAPYGGGWGGYPGYGTGSTIVVTPQSGDSEQKAAPRLPE